VNESAPLPLSRRDFLKTLGCAAGWLCLSPALTRAFNASVPVGDTAAALVDLTRCIGCRSCTRACRRQNQTRDPDTALAITSPADRMDLAYDEYTVVNPALARQAGKLDRVRDIKQQCMHCVDPACASACPVAALYKHELGPVLYRAERCIGCRYCMVACPFDVPKYDWHSGLTPVIGKCHFCAQERLFRGLAPACVEACPTGALKFGTRVDLLVEAHERINAHPEKYVNHVYGEDEAGGTSWLYLSDVPFETLGFKQALPKSPLPSFTWEVVSRLPSLVAVLAAVFGLVAAGLSRKESGA